MKNLLRLGITLEPLARRADGVEERPVIRTLEDAEQNEEQNEDKGEQEDDPKEENEVEERKDSGPAYIAQSHKDRCHWSSAQAETTREKASTTATPRSR